MSVIALLAAEACCAWSSLTNEISGTRLARPNPWARLAKVRQSSTIQGFAPLDPKNMRSSLIIDAASWIASQPREGAGSRGGRAKGRGAASDQGPGYHLTDQSGLLQALRSEVAASGSACKTADIPDGLL